MLTIAGAFIRPPLNWRRHDYQKLRELHDKVKAVKHVQTDQVRHNEPDIGNVSPEPGFLGLEELILDLRCCTSTLMDLVPCIEHTENVLANYVHRQHVSKAQKMKTQALRGPSTLNDKVKREALERAAEPNQRISRPEPQMRFSNTSSTVPLISTTGDKEGIRNVSQKIAPPDSQKSGSIATDNPPPEPNAVLQGASRKAIYDNGPPEIQRLSSEYPIIKPTIIATENPYTRIDEINTGVPKKNDGFSQNGMSPDSKKKVEKFAQPNSPKPSLEYNRHIPLLDNAINADDAVDSTIHGLANGTRDPRATGTYPGPVELLFGMCDICRLPDDSCVHSLTTTNNEPDFNNATFLEHSDSSEYPDLSSRYSSFEGFPTSEGSMSPILGSEPPLRYQTAAGPTIAKVHVGNTGTLGDRLLKTHDEDDTPGDRLVARSSDKPQNTRSRCADCGRIFGTFMMLRYVVLNQLSPKMV